MSLCFWLISKFICANKHLSHTFGVSHGHLSFPTSESKVRTFPHTSNALRRGGLGLFQLKGSWFDVVDMVVSYYFSMGL